MDIMTEGKPTFKLDGYYRWITVNGVMYNTDIIIHTDGSITLRDENVSLPYKDDFFHVPLSERELGFINEENPEKIIIGSGFKGMLPLTLGAKNLLKPYNYVEKVTTDAIEMINNEKGNFIAIMHIRC